jgi:hypothetical protein
MASWLKRAVSRISTAAQGNGFSSMFR